MPPLCTTTSHHRQAAENSIIPPNAALGPGNDLTKDLVPMQGVAGEWTAKGSIGGQPPGTRRFGGLVAQSLHERHGDFHSSRKS